MGLTKFPNGVSSFGVPLMGTLCLQDCAVFDFTKMAEAAVGIRVAGSVPTFATTGVSVAS